ncbi:chromosome segregation protein Spc25-domain-containing protein [Dipodascopsis tothii]|uniref:chromosome segregation protein Spc25-domain-containing protein n=1 Tax=Dipodascopsis tothii TaxID=44089 RepID=UPI0034CE75FD
MYQQMDAFQARFDAHLAAERTRILAERAQFDKAIADSRDQQQALAKQLDDVKTRELELEQARLRAQDEIETTEASIQSFTRKKQELSILQSALDAEIDETQALLRKRTEERAVQRSKILRQSSLNAPELTFWESRLGVRIEGVQDDMLKIVFTLVNEAAWEREYWVILDLASRDYGITQTEPALPAEVLAGVTARFNESRTFGVFLKAMRQAFKDSRL